MIRASGPGTVRLHVHAGFWISFFFLVNLHCTVHMKVVEESDSEHSRFETRSPDT